MNLQIFRSSKYWQVQIKSWLRRWVNQQVSQLLIQIKNSEKPNKAQNLIKPQKEWVELFKKMGFFGTWFQASRLTCWVGKTGKLNKNRTNHSSWVEESGSKTHAGPATVCWMSTVVLNTVKSRLASRMFPLQYGREVVSDAAIKLDDRSTCRVSLSDRRDSYSAHWHTQTQALTVTHSKMLHMQPSDVIIIKFEIAVLTQSSSIVIAISLSHQTILSLNVSQLSDSKLSRTRVMVSKTECDNENNTIVGQVDSIHWTSVTRNYRRLIFFERRNTRSRCELLHQLSVYVVFERT